MVVRADAAGLGLRRRRAAAEGRARRGARAAAVVRRRAVRVVAAVAAVVVAPLGRVRAREIQMLKARAKSDKLWTMIARRMKRTMRREKMNFTSLFAPLLSCASSSVSSPLTESPP